MATVCLRSHEDISGGRETVPVSVDNSVNLLDKGLLDFTVKIRQQYTSYIHLHSLHHRMNDGSVHHFSMGTGKKRKT